MAAGSQLSLGHQVPIFHLDTGKQQIESSIIA
jgi:hypothetical protein